MPPPHISLATVPNLCPRQTPPAPLSEHDLRNCTGRGPGEHDAWVACRGVSGRGKAVMDCALAPAVAALLVAALAPAALLPQSSPAVVGVPEGGSPTAPAAHRRPAAIAACQRPGVGGVGAVFSASPVGQLGGHGRGTDDTSCGAAPHCSELRGGGGALPTQGGLGHLGVFLIFTVRNELTHQGSVTHGGRVGQQTLACPPTSCPVV